MIASLRYLDTFAKIDGSWYFAERKLILDWSETRSAISEASCRRHDSRRRQDRRS